MDMDMASEGRGDRRADARKHTRGCLGTRGAALSVAGSTGSRAVYIGGRAVGFLFLHGVFCRLRCNT